MKKLVSGMLFVAAMGLSFGGTVANAQGGLGGDGSEKWVCCLVEDEFCEDWLGGAWSDSRAIVASVCP